MKKTNLMWMAILAIAAMTTLSGCSWFCPECPKCPACPECPEVTKEVCVLPTTFKSITSLEANTLLGAYHPDRDAATTGALLEGGLVKFFSCTNYTNVYAEFGMVSGSTTVEVVYVCVKADGTKDYYSAISGSSSTGPTCPTRCP
ncbi:MAG: hypothetical protein ABIT08_14880 [Bacteroidia bacterium]